MKRKLEEESNTTEKTAPGTTRFKKLKKSGKNDGPKKSLVKSKQDAKGNFKKEFYNDKKQEQSSEKPDWNELKKKHKILKEKRREKRINAYAISDEAKQLFEELRSHKCPPEKRSTLASKLFSILSGKITNIVRSHDMARMVQWLIKIGSPEVKADVIKEVMKESLSMASCQYSNHIIKRIMKDGDKTTRKNLLNSYIGNVVKLLGNKFSAPILEELYTKHATTKEKAFMRQELLSDLFRGARNPNVGNLSQAFSENKTLKGAVLKSTKTILSKLIQKKTALSSHLMAEVLHDYLEHCEEKEKQEMLDLLRSEVRSLLKTRPGAEVAVHVLWTSSPKLKKSIIKDLKTNVVPLAKTEAGSIFLRALFDSVDDTVLVRKAILQPLVDQAEELLCDDHGRKVLLYMVAHRDTAFFHPAELEWLKRADEQAHVKKELGVRLAELSEPCLEPLLKKVAASPEQWLSDGKKGLVTAAVLRRGSGECLRQALIAVAGHLAAADVQDPGLHIVLKKLIKNTQPQPTFAECFVQELDSDKLKEFIKSNRGCFIIVFLIESGIESVLSILKEKLNEGGIFKDLKKQESQGAVILRKLTKENKML